MVTCPSIYIQYLFISVDSSRKLLKSNADMLNYGRLQRIHWTRQLLLQTKIVYVRNQIVKFKNKQWMQDCVNRKWGKYKRVLISNDHTAASTCLASTRGVTFVRMRSIKRAGKCASLTGSCDQQLSANCNGASSRSDARTRKLVSFGRAGSGGLRTGTQHSSKTGIKSNSRHIKIMLFVRTWHFFKYIFI